MDKKRSCLNCAFTDGQYCYGGYYGILLKDLEVCSHWELSFDDFIDLFQELEIKNKKLHDYYIYGYGNSLEYVDNIYKGV